MTMCKWFLLPEKEPRSAARNMATDEYLFNRCHEQKVGFFRLYSWAKPTFSFGLSQRLSKILDTEFISKNNCSYVRRMTGGKSVLHDDEVTYSVVSSEDIFYKDNDLYRSYMLISRILVAALSGIGLDVYLSQGSPSHLSRSNNPCFSFPTPNELEIEGKKIVGSAQKRDKYALLQHGSIPLSMNYDLYARGTRSDIEAIKQSMTTVSEVSDKTRDDVFGALINSFQSFVGAELEHLEFDLQARQAIDKIESKYNSDEWNHRL